VDSYLPFRFGIVSGGAASPAEWRSLARKAEDLGYSSLQLPDHFNDQYGPLVALAVTAEATSSLRLGTAVLDNDFRHPAVLAKEIATLDRFSGGRVELGIGAGWQINDYHQTGFVFDPPGTRYERLKEAVEVFRGSFGPGPFSFAGRHYTFSNYDGLPKPVQSPLPITVGAGGPRMLSLAARRADVVNFVPRALREGGMDFKDTSAEAFDKKTAIVREAVAGRESQPEIATLVHRVLITDSKADAQAAAERTAAGFGSSPDEALESAVVLIGSADYAIDKLWERRERFGLTYLSVLATNMEAFAPVVKALAGKVASSALR
jgi:probable F420-dependent oxidoreductase